MEKVIALSRGQHTGQLQLNVFSNADMKKITNNYDPNIIIGRIRSTVFKGTLEDRIVAVKAPIQLEPNPEMVNLFLTEASTAMAMNHENMVRIYGCCLHTPIPIIVYEFIKRKPFSAFTL